MSKINDGVDSLPGKLSIFRMTNALGISMRHAARIADVSPTTMGKWQSGEWSPPPDVLYLFDEMVRAKHLMERMGFEVKVKFKNRGRVL